MARKAASEASLTGMTGSRTPAKIGGVRSGRWDLVILGCSRLMVLTTTRARRLVSIGLPGWITEASASNIDLMCSGSSAPLPLRIYFPEARTQLSEKKGVVLLMPRQMTAAVSCA